MSTQKNIILCSLILGGAEIFTLERLLQCDTSSTILYCNSGLAQKIASDERYGPIQVVGCSGLDGLASDITISNIASAVSCLRSVFKIGNVLLGNLRAASMMLHPLVARRNDAFIHDNSHYLNIKARILIALVIARSRYTFFPCRHSVLRVPFCRLLWPRIVIDYFGEFSSLEHVKRSRPSFLRIAIIGRIEPAKNQKFAIDIANKLAGSGTCIHLSLVGSRTDERYYAEIMAKVDHPTVEVTQVEVLRSEIPDIIKNQDIILHTSIAESLPLILFEANIFQIPFFAVPVGGIPEVLPKKYWLDSDVDKCIYQIESALFLP